MTAGVGAVPSESDGSESDRSLRFEGRPPCDRCPLLSAQTDRIAVSVREHADPRFCRNLTWRVALCGASREQSLTGRVEIFDVGEGHRAPALAGRVEAYLEAVDVVPDVVRLVGVR